MRRSPEHRKRDLERIRHCLNTDEGKTLMEEIRSIVDKPLIGGTPQITGANVGAFEIYRLLLSIQNGETLNE